MDKIIWVINDIKSKNNYCNIINNNSKDLQQLKWFIETQIPFKQAVDNWSIILGKMIENIPVYFLNTS